MITPPGDSAGQPIRLRDVLTPAEQGEAGPHGSDQPDDAAGDPDVSVFQPHSWKDKIQP